MKALVSTPARPAVLAPSLEAKAPPRRGIKAALLSDGFILGTLLTLVFAGMGVWRAVVIQYAVGDAISRTYSASAVLYSHEPHLAAIGFIWPPIPAFMQLFLLRLTPALGFYGLSGNLVTAASAGMLATIVLGTLRHVGIGRWGSVALVVALYANPMMMFYSSNGMSELPFLVFLALAATRFALWAETGRWQPLAVAGFASAGMFFCRYDAAVIAVVMGLSIIPVMRLSHREFFPPKIEANMLAFAVPVAYVGFIWVYLNRIIMQDALYFWHSEYSNQFLTRTMKFSQEVMQLQGSLVFTARYFITVVGSFSPLFWAAVGLAVVAAFWRRDVAILCLAALFVAGPAFQLYTYRSGSTFNLPRFYISVIPAGLLLGAYVLKSMWGNNFGRAKFVLLLAGMLTSAFMSWGTMERELDPNVQSGVMDEGLFIQALENPFTPQSDYADDTRAAAYLNEHVNDRSILIDAVGTNVALLSSHLDHFYLPSDSDWDDAATHPQEKVKYIVAVGNAVLQYHVFLDLYPNLFENGTPFTKLEADLGNIRLYRVISS